MSQRAVQTSAAPPPVASYSQGVRFGDMFQVAGQGPKDSATGRYVEGGIKEQTRQTLENVRHILTAAGGSFADVVMVRIYLADRDDFALMNEVYAEYVSEPFPARTTVYVGLPPDMLVEIDVLATLNRDREEGATA
ncbi:MAG: RidA family protein [Micromonosporaceae bacterium]